MNFSHGSYEYHQSVIDNTRLAASRQSRTDSPVLKRARIDGFVTETEGRPLAIALDTVRLDYFRLFDTINLYTN